VRGLLRYCKEEAYVIERVKRPRIESRGTPTVYVQARNATKVGDILGDEGQAVNQGSGSYQDVCIADELPLLVKVSIDVRGLNNDVIGQCKDVAVAATLLKGGYLASSSSGFQAPEDLIAGDNRERKGAVICKVSPRVSFNLRVSALHHLR